MKAILLTLVLFASFKIAPGKLAADKTEAQYAFELINEIRSNPAAWSTEIGVDLNTVKKMPALIWNDTLAKTAETKALDMACRNYFGHVNPDGYGMNYYINQSGYPLNAEWLKDPKNNFFESIQAGASSGKEAIKFLIEDSNIPSLGHRKHLLGMDNWNSGLTDIGIGFVKSDDETKYKSYTCILIAKHNW